MCSPTKINSERAIFHRILWIRGLGLRLLWMVGSSALLPCQAQTQTAKGTPWESSVFEDSLSHHRAQADWGRWSAIMGLQTQYLAQQGRLVEALELLKRESSVVDSLDYPEWLAQHYHHFGTYFFETNDFRNAELYHLLAYETLPKNRRTGPMQAQFLSELAHVYFYLDKSSPEPRRRFDSIQNAVLQRYLELGDSVSFAFELANRFDYIYEHFGLDSLLRALDLCEQFDNRKSDSLSVNFLWEIRGSFLSLSGDSTRGRYWVRKALGMAERLQFGQRIADLYDALSLTYQDRGEWEKAFQWSYRARYVQDSLNSVERGKAAERFRAEMDTERHQFLAEKRKARLWWHGTAIVALSLIGTIGVLFYQQRAMNRKKAVVIAHQEIDRLIRSRESASLESLLQGQETERKRIGRDLHDRLGGLLAAVRVNMEHHRLLSGAGNPEDVPYFAKSNDLLKEAMDEVRRVSHDLSSGVLVNFGLLPALRELGQSISNGSTMQVDITAFGLQDKLEQSLEIQLYRIVQELIANTLKHAQARHISIDLTLAEGQLCLTYEDDGAGFNTGQTGEGIGLNNINSRLEPYSGQLVIDSAPGRGSTFIIQLPIHST